MPNDDHTNEWAYIWDTDTVGRLAEQIGDDTKGYQRARGIIGMLHKRVGAVRAAKGLKAALSEPRRDVKSYAIMAAREN